MGVSNHKTTVEMSSAAIPARTEDMGDFPLLIAEEPIDRSLASVYNRKCSDQGGIHENRIGNTKRVHAFRTAASGAYLGTHFGTTPHYNVASNQFDDFSKEAKNKGVPCKLYGAVTNHNTDVINVVNIQDDEVERPEIECRLLSEMNNLDFEEIYAELNTKRKQEDMKGVNELRGTTQQHFGYAGNHSLKRNDEGHAKPVLVNENLMTDKVRCRFKTLTRIADLMKDHRDTKQGQTDITKTKKKGWQKKGTALSPKMKSVFSDDGRHLEFSAKIHPANRIDANTNSLSGSKDLVNIHCDILNDDTPLGIEGNYQYVIVVWKCYLRQNGKIDRLAIIGYSRRSISDAIRRKDVVDTLYEEKISKWIQDQGEWRTNVDVDERIFKASTYPDECIRIDEDTGIMGLCPMFNKQAGLLSGFTDSIFKMREAFPTMMGSLHKCCELILCIGFCNTAQKFRSVVTEWIKNGDVAVLGQKNLVTEMLDMISSNPGLGSLSSGLFRRFQPTFNRHTVLLKWIRAALNVIKDTILLCRSNKAVSFATASAKICSIQGFGHLIGQHIIHCMAMATIIPARFGAEATVCESTSTYKRLEQVHGISKSKLPTLIAVLDNIFGWESFISENVICKWAIDEHKGIAHLKPSVSHTKYYDCIYPDQDYVMYCKKKKEGGFGIRLVKKGKHQPDRFAHYEQCCWTCPNSILVRKDSFASSDPIWNCNLEDNLGNKFVFMTYKARNVNSVDQSPLQGETRTRRPRRSRVNFQQTRWGTVVTEDPEMGGSHFGPKKRKRRAQVASPFHDTEKYWRIVDSQDLRREEMNFIMSERHKKYGSGEQYGVSCNQGNHHLRRLHKDGKLKILAHRESRSTDQLVAIKPCTHLLTLGMLLLPFDLNQACALSLGWKSFDDISNKIMDIEMNGGFYSILHQENSSITLRTKDRFLAIAQGQSKLTCQLVSLPDSPILYKNKQAARTALLWYICSTVGYAQIWISRMYREDEWTAIDSQETSNGDRQCSRYLSLQLGGMWREAPW